MKLATCLVLSLMLFSCASAGRKGRSFSSVDSKGDIVPIKLAKKRIVILKKNVTGVKRMQRELARKHNGQRGHVFTKALKGFVISVSDNAFKQIKNDKRVKYIVNDKPVKAFAQEIPTGVQRIKTQLNSIAAINNDGGSVDVDVAVLDTGIDLDHPDLNVYRSVNFAKGKSADDGNGHGTHVAGSIGALDNNQGVVGVAPGVRLWAVRVLDNRGSGWTSDIIAGIDYVTANASQIEVVNMSLGGRGTDDGNCGLTNNDPQHEAICNSVKAGVVYVVAAGNDNDDSKNYVPASYDEVITVSALNDSDGLAGGLGPSNSRGDDDTLADFSNFGEDVDIAAPGVNINSTWKDGGYNSISGTSMASPHVAGAVALYISKNGRANNEIEVENIKQALQSLAWAQDSDNGFSGDKDAFSEPLLNAEAISPMAPPEPSVNMYLSLDKTKYYLSQGETQSLISVNVKDENQNSISGLSNESFGVLLDNEPITLNFNETDSGHYTSSLDLNPLQEGVHNINISVTDGRGLSNSQSKDFETTYAEVNKIYVGNITYSLSGGKSQDKNLVVTVEVIDTQQTVVDGAVVSMGLFHQSSGFIGSATGTTDSNGRVSFQLRNASSGCYYSEINGLEKTGQQWDSTLDVVDEGFCKP